MPDGNPRPSLPLVLVARDERGASDWLIDLLIANGYAVLSTEHGAPLRVRAAAAHPDMIVLSETTDGDGAALARRLRVDGHIDPSTPILLLCSRAATRAERLAALRDGVWDVIAPPYDPELLLQEIATFVAARLDATRAHFEGLIDRPTLLYNRVGLARRASELGALAYREHAAIGCLALVLDVSARPGGEADPQTVVSRCVQAMRGATRQSDAVGRLGAAEFAIVAPGADAAGCRTLARRVVDKLRAAGDPAFPPRVRGGYDAVFNAGYAPFAPVDLLVRAATAVRTGAVERELEWLRRFADVMGT